MKADALKQMPEDCSTSDVASALGLAVRSVQLMVDRGELAAWKTPGGHRRIARDSVLRWLDARESSSTYPTSHTLPIATPPSLEFSAGRWGRLRLRRRKRVLLIEDSAHFQNLVSLLMAHEFPEVELHVAEDGILGLIKAGELRPDVVLIDLLLPGVDGATLISRLREYTLFQQSQLVVVTSLNAEQRIPFAMALFDLPVIHKPFLARELPALLKTYLKDPLD